MNSAYILKTKTGYILQLTGEVLQDGEICIVTHDIKVDNLRRAHAIAAESNCRPLNF